MTARLDLRTFCKDDRDHNAASNAAPRGIFPVRRQYENRAQRLVDRNITPRRRRMTTLQIKDVTGHRQILDWSGLDWTGLEWNGLDWMV